MPRRISDRARRAALVLLFALSGVGGLSLEIVWARQLRVSIGSTSHATALAVALFMAGLAIGSALAARYASRLRSPVRAYALTELGVALTAGLCSVLLPAIEGAPDGLTRYALATCLMLPPTVGMGMTWPWLCAAWQRGEPSIAGRLYAVNTLGASIGALLAGFVAIGWLGLTRTGAAAALIDGLCGLVALAIGDEAARDPMPARVTPEPVPSWLVALAAVSGMVALAEEILWTRTLAPYVSSSTYAFAAILSVYLLGLAAGSGLASRRREGDAAADLVHVQLALAMVVAASPLGLALAEALVPVYVGVRRATTFDAWLVTALGSFAKAALALALPTALLGATTPLAIRVALGAAVSAPRAAGAYASANTVGAIGGTVLAGFVMLPVLGAHRALLACGLVHLGLAIAWASRTPAVFARSRIALVAAVALAAGLASPAVPFTGRLTEGFTLLLVDEGPEDTTLVVELGSGPARHRGILSNGVMYAGDSPGSRRYMSLLGHLPALLADDPARALVVCIGTGTTAGAVARHADVRSLTLVDVSPAVHRTLPFFAHVNHRVWRDPRVSIVEADGRQFLSRHAGRFGLVTLEPPPPRMAGAASLYSRELYERARSSLAPGGVVAQWLPLHGMTAGETWMLARTFLDVFPDGALFVLTDDEAALIGGVSPWRPDLDRLRARLSDPALQTSLATVGIEADGPEALATSLVSMSPASGASLRALAGDGPRVTDDRPLIEQFAVGLAREEGSAQTDAGRFALFRALGRARPVALPTRGAPLPGLDAALDAEHTRYGSLVP